MLIIHVTHHLNTQGIQYFEEWYQECYDFVSKQDGFHLLEKAYDNVGTGAIHIWLHFESREKMLAWGNSEQHANLINKLDSYRTKDWEATWYDTQVACVEKFIIPIGLHSVVNN
jgi:antibiotic biosynthesis monooxygenase (ABM) superfamily enzyme